MENIYESVKKNPLGFYELSEKYRKNMDDFYENEYYQNDKALYKKEYSNEEITYMNNLLKQKEYIFNKYAKSPNSFLDIGCGEGYALNFFSKKYNIKGIDYSDFGIKTHNPNMLKYLIKGDIMDCIKNIDETFDLINLDNVLEHLPNPQEFLQLLKKICNNNTIICISVPNDFSMIQIKLCEEKIIKTPFWVTEKTSEHFNYFSTDSLKKFIENNGFEVLELIGDYPIDLNLFNPKTNYIKYKNVGKDCHIARIKIENILFESSFEKTIELHKLYANLGIGRDISIYIKL